MPFFGTNLQAKIEQHEPFVFGKTIIINVGGTAKKMIKVVDAIMGAGKSCAAINYMNAHPEERFIYITPFLTEAERIKEFCPDLKFVTPSSCHQEYDHKKTMHTAALIKKGENISSTHQAFKRYTQEMLDDIREAGYILIVDECLDMLEQFQCHKDDIDMAVRAGYLECRDGQYFLVRDDYNGVFMREMFNMLKNRGLVCVDDGDGVSCYYWIVSAELMMAFKDVIILTYLFEGHSMYQLMAMNSIEYEKMSVDIDENGNYVFCDCPGRTPEYVYHLKDMIHIIDADKVNEIGEERTALSKSWFQKNDELVEQLKKNIYNVMHNYWRGVDSKKKLWSTFNCEEKRLRGKGYSKAFLQHTQRSSNEYRDRTHLVYAVNSFMNTNHKKYFYKNGLDVDENMYALSIMIQWIWRSAIRDGKEIYLYLPSSRMREILISWIDKVSKGGECVG